MLPASAYPHTRPAARRLIDAQTDAIVGGIIDLLGLGAVLAFGLGMGTAGPLLHSLFGG